MGRHRHHHLNDAAAGVAPRPMPNWKRSPGAGGKSHTDELVGLDFGNPTGIGQGFNLMSSQRHSHRHSNGHHRNKSPSRRDNNSLDKWGTSSLPFSTSSSQSQMKIPTTPGHMLNPSSRVLPPSALPSETQCIVLYEYKAKYNDELSIRKDDRLIVQKKVNDDWYQGRNAISGKQGIFPVSFVRILQHNTGIGKPIGGRSPPCVTPVFVESDKDKLYDVMFDFTAANGDELNLRQGQKVIVAGKINDDWLVGRLEKESDASKNKMFPAAFVSKNRPNIVKQVSYTPTLTNHKQTNGANHKQPSAPTRKGMLIYDFKSENETELTCFTGAMVNVIEVNKSGWALVEYKSNRGYVPESYLKYMD